MRLVRYLCLLALAMPVRVAPAKAQDIKDLAGLPGGAHGAVARAVVEALSQGDGEGFATLLQDRGTTAFAASRKDTADWVLARRFGRRTQGVTVWGHRVFPAPPDSPPEINVLVKENLSGRWRQVSVVFDGERIDDFGLAFAMEPQHDVPGSLTREEALDHLSAYLRKAAAAELFSGVVLIGQGDQERFLEAHGLASRRYAVPNQAATRFDLASLGKAFTATLVLQKVEQGTLNLDTPIGDLVSDDWIGEADGRSITIEHLLSHTSGLDTHFTEQFLSSARAEYRDFHAFAQIVREQTPLFPPGTRWHYSNAGYLLLGAALEAVAHETYEAQLETDLFRRAGMRECGCFSRDDPVPDVATNYWLDLEAATPEWHEETLLRPIRGGPAGGCYATAGDLFRFVRGLVTHTVLTETMLAEAWSNHAPEGTPRGYGYGFQLGGGALGRWVGHSGGFVGPNTEMRYYSDSDWVVIVLSNYSEGVRDVTDMVEWLLSRIDP